MQEKVTQLLEQALEKNKSLFLIDLRISESNQIMVVIDGDNGVTLKDCIAVSREIEHNLDREETDFSLEVTSAGVSEPLTLVRQYKKMFEMEGVDLTFQKEAISLIARQAIDRKLGARGLRLIMEDLMLEYLFELPSRHDMDELVITADMVGNKNPKFTVLEEKAG